MKNILKIAKRDFKRIVTNWVALVVVIALMIIPSLYSLVNIYASWEPYSNTSGIKIGIVNEDKGTHFLTSDIDLGSKIVEELGKNDQMGWQFIDRETAEEGLINEEYYAAIIIPEDFSENAMSVLGKNPTQPKIIYTANERKNPITPKFTDKAVQALEGKVNSTASKIISGILLKLYNELGVDLDANRSDLRILLDKAYDLDGKLDDIQTVIDGAADGTVSASDLMAEIQDVLPLVTDVMDTGSDFLTDSIDDVDDVGEIINNSYPDVVSGFDTIAGKTDDVNLLLKDLDENILPEEAYTILSKVNDTSNDMIIVLGDVTAKLNKIENVLNKIDNIKIPEADPDKALTEAGKDLLNKYNQQAAALKKIKDSIVSLNNIVEKLNGRVDTVSKALTNISQKSSELMQKIENGEGLDLTLLTDLRQFVSDLSGVFDTAETFDVDGLVSDINTQLDLIKNMGDMGVNLMGGGKDAISSVDTVLTDFTTLSDDSHDEIVKLQENFPEMAQKYHDLVKKLKLFDNTEDVDNIISLVSNDWQAQSDFLSQPVELESQSLYPWPNYGSTATPFYTTLCLWIGGYMLSILFSTKMEPEKDEGIEEYKPYENYFGKMFLFVTVGIFQALIASLGALFILKVYCVHPVMFVLFAVFTSVSFMLIIYSLTSMFAHGGIVMGIVLLVVQITASNANFPIQVNPLGFQKLYPFLPFSYAISGMRQCMAGAVYDILFKDIAFLAAVPAVLVVITVIFKKKANKFIAPFLKKLEEGKVFG